MRTTLDLPDVLARRAKQAALHRGTSLKAVVVAALERDLAPVRRTRGEPVHFPLLRSKRPGARKLTPDRVHEILMNQEIAAHAVAGGR